MSSVDFDLGARCGSTDLVMCITAELCARSTHDLLHHCGTRLGGYRGSNTLHTSPLAELQHAKQ